MKLTLVLCETSTVPDCEKPFGPVMTQLTVSIVALPSTSDIPTEPSVSVPLTMGCESPEDEQPAACVAAIAESALAKKSFVRWGVDDREFCGMVFPFWDDEWFVQAWCRRLESECVARRARPPHPAKSAIKRIKFHLAPSAGTDRAEVKT